jgi:SNF2 family DNA or RNA helicase
MLKRKLRDYQLEAVAKASPHPGFALFLEQRTGKCLTSLALVDQRKPLFLMIVTTKKGKEVWKREIKESIEFDWKCIVVITHFQELHLERKNWRKYFREKGPHGLFIICDESHKIKKRGSRPARTIRYLGSQAQWRLALTGTPLQPRSRTKRRKRTGPEVKVTKGLEDAWSQFDFIDPSIFGSAESFEDTYLKKGGFRGFQTIGYKNTKKFYRLFHKYSYRKLLREVQEAGKRTIIKRVKIKFNLGPKTRKIYDSMDRRMYADVNGHRITIPLVVARTQKLQQIASGFLIDTETKEAHSVGECNKLLELAKLLSGPKIFSQGHGEKVVICAKFIPEIKDICNLLSRMGLSHQVISGKEEFSGDFKVDVTVVQIQSGVAIDLSQADTFIFYSCGHNFIDYEQARFRILSFSKRQATFYYLLANDSMDELVYEAQTKKKDLSTLVLEHYRRKYEQPHRTSRRLPVSRRPRLLGR